MKQQEISYNKATQQLVMMISSTNNNTVIETGEIFFNFLYFPDFDAAGVFIGAAAAGAEGTSLW